VCCTARPISTRAPWRRGPGPLFCQAAHAVLSCAAHLLHALRMEQDDELIDEEHQRRDNAQNGDCGRQMPVMFNQFGEAPASNCGNAAFGSSDAIAY